VGVVVCSNDLEDAISTCHRVLVIRQGRLVTEIEGNLDERQLMSIAAHGTDEAVVPVAPNQA
jgi:ABC-type sugar transport system ATPase subunit